MSHRRYTMFVGILGIAMAMLFAVAPTHAVRHAVNEWLHHAGSDAHHDHDEDHGHHDHHHADAHESCQWGGGGGGGLAGDAFSALPEHHSHPQQCCEAPAPLNVIHVAMVNAADWATVFFVAACFDPTQRDPLRTPLRYVNSDPPPASPAMLSLRSIVLLT